MPFFIRVVCPHFLSTTILEIETINRRINLRDLTEILNIPYGYTQHIIFLLCLTFLAIFYTPVSALETLSEDIERIQTNNTMSYLTSSIANFVPRKLHFIHNNSLYFLASIKTYSAQTSYNELI